MAQRVKCLALDFGTGHDLMVHGFEPHTRLSAVSMEPASDPQTLSAPCPHSCSLSLSKLNIRKKNFLKEKA